MNRLPNEVYQIIHRYCFELCLKELLGEFSYIVSELTNLSICHWIEVCEDRESGELIPDDSSYEPEYPDIYVLKKDVHKQRIFVLKYWFCLPYHRKRCSCDSKEILCKGYGSTIDWYRTQRAPIHK